MSHLSHTFAAAIAAALLALCLWTFPARAQAPTTAPATRSAPAEGGAADVDRLRAALQQAYSGGDVNALVNYLHPQVVIVFPDGEILQGRDALIAYMERMLNGPDAIVASYTTDPIVDERFMHGDTVVSHGRMNDQYVLTSGESFGLDSRFTVTAIRTPDGPPDTGGWVVRSFHSSTDAFDNAVLGIAIRRTIWYGGIAGAIVGLLLGTIIGWLLASARRRGRAPESVATTG